MINSFKIISRVLLFGGLFIGAAAPAGAVAVNGVSFDIGANLGVNSFYQNSPTAIGQTLSAVGRLDEINNNVGFCSGCELDFVAQNFTVSSLSGGNLGFTGGNVTLYVNAPGALNTNAGSLAAIISGVSGGLQWLN